MRFPAKITSSCIWVAIPVDWIILHWYACGADGRSGGRSVYGHVITKFSRMGRLLHFFTHGAALARFARESSAMRNTDFNIFCKGRCQLMQELMIFVGSILHACNQYFASLQNNIISKKFLKPFACAWCQIKEWAVNKQFPVLYSGCHTIKQKPSLPFPQPMSSMRFRGGSRNFLIGWGEGGKGKGELLNEWCSIHQGRHWSTTGHFQRYVSTFCIRALACLLSLQYLNTTHRSPSGNVVMRKIKMVKFWR